jgi:hypothetical protein
MMTNQSLAPLWSKGDARAHPRRGREIGGRGAVTLKEAEVAVDGGLERDGCVRVPVGHRDGNQRRRRAAWARVLGFLIEAAKEEESGGGI